MDSSPLMQIRDAGADAHGPTRVWQGRPVMEADRPTPHKAPAVQQAPVIECFWPTRGLR